MALGSFGWLVCVCVCPGQPRQASPSQGKPRQAEVAVVCEPHPLGFDFKNCHSGPLVTF